VRAFLRGALAALALLALSAPGASAQYDCQGTFPGQAPNPKTGTAPLVFGIYPLGFAGQVGVPAALARPEDAALRNRRLHELSGPSRPFVVHLYVTYKNTPDLQDEGKAQLRALDEITAAGFDAELVLTYRPNGGGGGPTDVPGYVAFVRSMIGRLASNRHLTGIQVTNEANNNTSPDASDGSFAGVREALVKGVIAAKDEARKRGLSRLHVGFNWFYRLDPQSEQDFWSSLKTLGGKPFVDALDWVGLDAYPGTFFPPAVPPDGSPGDARDAMVNAMSVLRDCYMPLAGIGKAVPIHVTENGYPTGPGRDEDEQVRKLRAMVAAVNDYRRNYNVTDYRWFSLRDTDTGSPNFQLHYGLLHDDYAPKPAFSAYRDLIAHYGTRAGSADRSGRGGSASGCLARRAGVVSRGIGRVRLGASRRVLERRLGAPRRRRGSVSRWCVTGGGSVVVAFARGQAALVATTARGHRSRRIAPGSSARVVRRTFPFGRLALRGVRRAGRRSRVVIGVRSGRVGYLAVARRPLLVRPATLARYLHRVGLR
jgi:hypothetical protein